MFGLYVNGSLLGTSTDYCVVMADVRRLMEQGIPNTAIRIFSYPVGREFPETL